jgi:hypothetical protein
VEALRRGVDLVVEVLEGQSAPSLRGLQLQNQALRRTMQDGVEAIVAGRELEGEGVGDGGIRLAGNGAEPVRLLPAEETVYRLVEELLGRHAGERAHVAADQLDDEIRLLQQQQDSVRLDTTRDVDRLPGTFADGFPELGVGERGAH